MHSTRTAIATAIALVCAHATAYPQDPAADAEGTADTAADGGIEAVTISASRVIRDGYEQPTPVTVIGPEQLQALSPSLLVDVAKTLPQFKNVTGPEGSGTTTVNGGHAGMNLRGLGVNRNLILLDRRRVAPSTANGRVDVNILPSALIKRIDVVTGGASAAWGSDAVSGVVNFILDTDYTGVKTMLEGGRSEEGDSEQRQITLVAGTPFHGGRGHVVFSAEQFKNDGVLNMARAWQRRKVGLVPNPNFTPTNGQAQRHLVEGIVSATMTHGGLITGGRNANNTVNNSLRGIAFGPGGVPYNFQYGTYVSFTGNMVAPPDPERDYYNDTDYTTVTDGGVIEHPSDRHSFFGHAKYSLTDNVTAFVEAMYTGSELGPYQTAAPFALGTSPTNSFIIRADNAYLPDSIRAQMSGTGGGNPAGPATIFIGRNATEWGGFEKVWNWNRTRRAVAGLNGEAFGSWRWNAYYQYGINKYENIIPRNTITSRNGNVALGNINLASDAVIAPAGNPAGIPAGTITCRSTLTNPGNGCVPLNVFGLGTASQEAIDYFYGYQWTTVDYEQHAVEADMQGEPFSTWAGPVSVGFGAAYREESAVQLADDLSIEGAYVLGNPKPFSGRDEVKEVFLETIVPLASEVKLAHHLEVSLAGRSTDYSSSGRVETWKAGLGYSPFSDQLRFRATRSRDIRAPSLDERFLGPQQFITTVIDPFTTPPSTASPWRINVGNPSVAPEIADTWAAGIVFQPEWLRGFSASFDYYDISIEDALAQISPQRTIDDCFAGATELCPLLRRDVNGLLIEVVQPFLNIASLTARGYDIETTYRRPVGAGDLAVRALASRVLAMEESDGRTTTVTAGEVTQPEWQGQLQIIYDRDPFAIATTGQYYGGARLSNVFTISDPQGNDVNEIGSRWYINLNFAFKLEPANWPRSELYLNVNNLTDLQPPYGATSAAVFDTIGRMYKMGLRVEF